MKRVFLVVFTIISMHAFAQNWTDYRIDSTVSLMLPDNYKVIDTLGQRLITAQVENGLIILGIQPNVGKNTFHIENDDDLIKAYKGFEKGYIGELNGQLVTEEIIETSGLKMTRFLYRAAVQDEQQLRHCLTVFVNEKMYSFDFWEPESMTKEAEADRNKLFSSLKFIPNLGPNNQITNKANEDRAYNQGLLMGKITALVLVVVVVLWSVRRGKKKKANA